MANFRESLLCLVLFPAPSPEVPHYANLLVWLADQLVVTALLQVCPNDPHLCITRDSKRLPAAPGSVSISELSANLQLNSTFCLVIWSHPGHLFRCGQGLMLEEVRGVGLSNT